MQSFQVPCRGIRYNHPVTRWQNIIWGDARHPPGQRKSRSRRDKCLVCPSLVASPSNQCLDRNVLVQCIPMQATARDPDLLALLRCAVQQARKPTERDADDPSVAQVTENLSESNSTRLAINEEFIPFPLDQTPIVPNDIKQFTKSPSIVTIIVSDLNYRIQPKLCFHTVLLSVGMYRLARRAFVGIKEKLETAFSKDDWHNASGCSW